MGVKQAIEPGVGRRGESGCRRGGKAMTRLGHQLESARRGSWRDGFEHGARGQNTVRATERRAP